MQTAASWRVVSVAAAGVIGGLLVAGCGGQKALNEAIALEESGDAFGALQAYEDVIATYGGGAIEEKAGERQGALSEAIVADLVDKGMPGFDIPEDCQVQSTAWEPVEAGLTVEVTLLCDGREARTSGRIIEPEKVWDLTPVTGVLQAEGECVFRSVANPFGDWAIPLPADECHQEQRKRTKALERYKQPGGKAAFECDCRVGQAEFEVPRGKPMWQTGPPSVPMNPDRMPGTAPMPGTETEP